MNLFDVVPLKGKNFTDLEPATAPHYVVAKEGVYLRKETVLGTCVIKEDGKSDLKGLNSIGFDVGYFLFTAPKIPAKMFAVIVDFFTEALNRFNTEAEVLLLYNPERRRYRVFIPHQYATGTSVDSIYDRAEFPDGYTEVGTVHSHCDFGAFHSGTDESDARGFNGLHITIGELNRNEPDFAAMIMMNGVQFTIDIDKVANVDLTLDVACPESWFEFFGKPHEIIKRKFTTLTQAELDIWHKSVITPQQYTWALTPTNNGKGKSNGKDKSKSKDDPSWIGGNRLSSEIDSFVPAEWLEYTTSRLRNEFVERAFEWKLDKLYDAAMKRGFVLLYDLVPAEKITPEAIEKVMGDK